jgi:hypothetical protein
MSEMRLGDVIDDHCIKCRRVTNHAIVSIVNGEAAKVRCRTCYHDHDYRHEQAPPSKKDLKKAELFKEVLAAAAVPGESAGAPEESPAAAAVAEVPEGEEAAIADPPPAKKSSARKKAV